MRHYHIIAEFVNTVRKRLNQGVLLRAGLLSVGAACAGIITVALMYVVRGYRCPAWVFGAALGVAATGVVLMWLVRRYNERRAGAYADDFFDLKDGICSYMGFHDSGKEEGFYRLQEVQVEKELLLKVRRVKEIPLGVRPVLLVGVAVLAAAAGVFGFIDDSAAVKEQKAIEEQVAFYAEVNRKELQDEVDEAVEELKKDLDDPELEKDLDRMKQLAEELEVSKDLKDLLRQYAELEKQLQAMLGSGQLKKDEQLLSKAAEHLRKTAEGKELGKKLAQKDYKQAAADLQQFKRSPEDVSREAMREQARLKVIAQQMAAAVNPSQLSISEEGMSSEAPLSELKPGNCCEKEGGCQVCSKRLADMILRLKKSVGACQKSQCQANCSRMNMRLSDMGDKLCRMENRRLLQKKFARLSDKLGQCQSRLCGACNKPGSKMMAGTKPGGKKAGGGSVDSRADETAPNADNGNVQALQGLKGQGPAQVRVEESGSGTGVSGLSGRKVQKEYQKQAEAYVEREDVPAELKQGVKRYFETIHGSDRVTEQSDKGALWN